MYSNSITKTSSGPSSITIPTCQHGLTCFCLPWSQWAFCTIILIQFQAQRGHLWVLLLAKILASHTRQSSRKVRQSIFQQDHQLGSYWSILKTMSSPIDLQIHSPVPLLQSPLARLLSSYEWLSIKKVWQLHNTTSWSLENHTCDCKFWLFWLYVNQLVSDEVHWVCCLCQVFCWPSVTVPK